MTALGGEKKTIGLVGFGKIGQAVAAQIVGSGCRLAVVDINQHLIDALKTGDFSSSEPDVGAPLVVAAHDGSLSGSTDFALLGSCEAVIVCIPLLVSINQDGSPKIDFEPFDACFSALAPHVHDKMVVSLETTVPVGTCRERICGVFAAAGKKHGRDYLLIHSPERIKSGSMRAQLTRNPKIIGGVNAEAKDAGVALYRRFIPEAMIRPVETIEAAEMIKLAGMVYRDINIALANQLARYCDATGLDVTEIIQLANTDNEANILLPGIGVGGHCTPVYPYFLIENFKDVGLDFSLAADGRQINDGMPECMVAAACVDCNIKSALILGLGFRPDVKADICSPAYALKEALQKRGVGVWLHDPLYAAEELAAKGFTQNVATPYERGFDVVILNTAHQAFKSLDFSRLASLGVSFLSMGVIVVTRLALCLEALPIVALVRERLVLVPRPGRPWGPLCNNVLVFILLSFF